LSVGADSATASVLAAGLVGIAAIGTPEYVAYASLLALMAAALLIAARLVKLGFLADFLSRTVLVGFLTGVGFQVGVAQIPEMLGLPGRTGLAQPIEGLVRDFQQITHTNLYTLAITLAVLAVIIVTKRISRRIPGALIAVVGAIIVSFAFNVSSHNVTILGTIPSGLPKLGLPQVDVNWDILERLLPTAFAMFVIILTQSSATARSYATRYNEHLNENRDLIALGIANIGAGLSGTFVVNGSPTQSQMVNSSGGRTQLAQLTAVAVVLMVLLFLTGPLAYMPTAVLAAIVFLIARDLIDVKGMRKIFIQRPSEFWVAIITAATVFIVGVEQGIILALFLSLLDHVRRGYRPKNAILAMDDAGHLKQVPIGSRAQLLPGLMIYRFNHSMYYANADLFSQEIMDLVNGAVPPIIWFCFDATSVDDVDFSAAAALRETFNFLKQRGVRLVLAEVENSVRAELDRYEITQLIGKDVFFNTINEVQIAYKRATADASGQRVLGKP
jgi:high affinity sulfate transporter 1